MLFLGSLKAGVIYCKSPDEKGKAENEGARVLSRNSDEGRTISTASRWGLGQDLPVCNCTKYNGQLWQQVIQGVPAIQGPTPANKVQPHQHLSQQSEKVESTLPVVYNPSYINSYQAILSA